MPTAIEWTDEAWNPITGCTPISPACDHCYARGFAHRLRGRAGYEKIEPFAVKLRPERLLLPFGWRKPRHVFIASMGDLFHAGVPDHYLDRVFAVMALTFRHTYQVLTKRIERAAAYLRDEATPLRIDSWIDEVLDETGGFDVHARRSDDARARAPDVTGDDWPLANVGIGATIEDDQRARERAPVLASIDAAVRFASCEPLLSELTLEPWIDRLGWIIAGGESGSAARPTHPRSFRRLRDEAQKAGVPFFFKSWGAWALGTAALRSSRLPFAIVRPHGGFVKYRTLPTGIDTFGAAIMRQVGKGASGYRLDGQVHRERPKRELLTEDDLRRDHYAPIRRPGKPGLA